MSWTLTSKVLKLQAPSILAYALGSIFYSFLIVVLFQRFVEQHKTFLTQYVSVMPRALLRAFNVGGDFTTFGGFVGAEYLSFIWVVIVAAFVIAFTSGALAKELEQGTLELILAYPLGRVRFFASKLAALVIGLAVIVVATVGGIWFGALSQHLSVGPNAYLAVGALGLAFALAIGGYGFLFSAAASERAPAAGATAALTVLFYAVHFAAQTWDPFKGLSRLTLFNYYLPQDAINLGRVDLASIAVLLGVALIGTIAAAVIFRLRDLSL
jgi:ABC-2 type transport system permease protein